MRLLGKLSFDPLHYTSLERDKVLAHKFAKLSFDKNMKISLAGHGQMDILWWINNIEDYFSSIKIPDCSF